MTPSEFRKMALRLPEVVEASHMSHPDFRVGGKIFATLGAPGAEWGMVKLTPDEQELFVRIDPEGFRPVPGGWGRQGATNVRLKSAKNSVVREALLAAWRNKAPGGLAAVRATPRREKRATKETKKKTAKKTTRNREAVVGDPTFAPVVAAFANDPDVNRKRMFSSDNVLTVKGKIFAMLVRGRFVAKLPTARVDELVSTRRGERFDPGHGRLMKEWVSIPAGRADWVRLAKEANRYVRRGEPPRPRPP